MTKATPSARAGPARASPRTRTCSTWRSTSSKPNCRRTRASRRRRPSTCAVPSRSRARSDGRRARGAARSRSRAPRAAEHPRRERTPARRTATARRSPQPTSSPSRSAQQVQPPPVALAPLPLLARVGGPSGRDGVPDGDARVELVVARRGTGLAASSRPLELAVPLRVQLAAVKTQSPSGMQTAPMTAAARRRPTPSRRRRGSRPGCRERVRRGRDHRRATASTRQHRHRVVDARDDEQHALRDEPELRALLRRDERQDGGHHPDAEERDGREPRSTSAATKFASGMDRPKKAPRRRRAGRADEAVEHREDALAARCIARESGAMNVYSIVPSQRSHATVSVRNSKMIPR